MRKDKKRLTVLGSVPYVIGAIFLTCLVASCAFAFKSESHAEKESPLVLQDAGVLEKKTEADEFKALADASYMKSVEGVAGWVKWRAKRRAEDGYSSHTECVSIQANATALMRKNKTSFEFCEDVAKGFVLDGFGASCSSTQKCAGQLMVTWWN